MKYLILLLFAVGCQSKPEVVPEDKEYVRINVDSWGCKPDDDKYDAGEINAAFRLVEILNEMDTERYYGIEFSSGVYEIGTIILPAGYGISHVSFTGAGALSDTAIPRGYGRAASETEPYDMPPLIIHHDTLKQGK
jgi:hypothetical protein